MEVTARVLAVVTILRLCCLCQCQGQDHGITLTRLTEPVSHGEGPFWDSTDDVLYFVDIAGRALHRFNPSKNIKHSLTLDMPVSLVLPIQGQRHKFVISLGLELVILTWDWESGFHTVSTIVSVQGSAAHRFNDGIADANGRVWAGTMGREDATGVENERGALYRVDNNPTVPCRADPMVTPVTISNGMEWSADNKILYYIDTPTRRVDAFDYDLPSGNISNRRTVFELGSIKGMPDGMTIDSDGNLWIACWGGSQVIQVNPSTGQLLRQIKFPVERVTSAVFGGPKLDILYVTTMRTGLSPSQRREQPLAGSLWRVSGLNVTGTPGKPAVVNCKCNE